MRSRCSPRSKRSSRSKRSIKRTLGPRYVPQRTCIACRTERAKPELVRLVRAPRDPTGAGASPWQIQWDSTGKKAGRGAYLCRSPQCWNVALKKNRVWYALKMKPSPETQAQLLALSHSLLVEGTPISS